MISPDKVAFGAIKQSFPQWGFIPLISKIKDIQIDFEISSSKDLDENIKTKKINALARFGD
jgi:hypothetical protein